MSDMLDRALRTSQNEVMLADLHRSFGLNLSFVFILVCCFMRRMILSIIIPSTELIQLSRFLFLSCLLFLV